MNINNNNNKTHSKQSFTIYWSTKLNVDSDSSLFKLHEHWILLLLSYISSSTLKKDISSTFIQIFNLNQPKATTTKWLIKLISRACSQNRAEYILEIFTIWIWIFNRFIFRYKNSNYRCNVPLCMPIMWFVENRSQQSLLEARIRLNDEGWW